MALRTLAAGSAVAILLLGACSNDGSGTDGGEPEDAARGYDRDGWDPGAVARAQEVAERLEGVPNGCLPGSIDTHPWDGYRESYQLVDVPMPAASVGCTTDQEDDLHVEVFESAEALQAFVTAKADLICERGYAIGEGTDDPFPGLPYIAGADGHWIIETDTVPFTEQLAPIARGSVANMCPQAAG
jgi:hypothetical protein